MKHIVILMTLDTKGSEAAYIKARVETMGQRAMLVDVGIKGEPVGVVPDVTREEVARAGGTTLEAIRQAESRGEAVTRMAQAATALLEDLCCKGQVGGVLCVGGSGAIIGARAMQSLPFGIPKLVVSPLASGPRQFGPLVGTGDLLVMHSVVDILGLHPIAQSVFDRAVAAVVGMAGADRSLARPSKGNGAREDGSSRPGPSAPLIGVSMLGVTTRGVMLAREELVDQGFEPVVFHSSGVGGAGLERFVRERCFAAVLDYTTSELAGELYGGMHCAQGRLTAAGETGLPVVVLPGGVDFLVFGPVDTVPGGLRDRPLYRHDPLFTLVRTTAEEMREIGRLMARRLNAAKGPAAVVWPLGGLSEPARGQGPLADPAADAAGLEGLRSELRRDIPVLTVDAHINDPECGHTAAATVLRLLGEARTSATG